MKKPGVQYELEARGDRSKKELITARITGGWYTYLNNRKKYDRVKVSLQATIFPKNWGKAETKYKFDVAVFDKFSKTNGGVKSAMNRLENIIDRMYSNYLKNDEQPTADEFKKELLIQLGRDERKILKDITIYSYLDEKIDYLTSIIGTGRKDEIKESTIKIYRTLVFYIERWDKYNKHPLTFNNLNETIYNKFWEFQDNIVRGKIVAEVEGKRKQAIQSYGLTKNSVQKYQKVLLTVCRWAAAEGIHVTLNIKDSNLIIQQTEVKKDIYLNVDNLQKIINHTPENEDSKIARDFVILSALTGMRYESMVAASKEKIQHHKDSSHNFQYIHSEQGKTSTEAIIPLLPEALKVIKSNGNKFPIFPVNSEMNESIKQLFAESNITAAANLKIYPFIGEPIVEKTTVDKLISCHDMRKSFYTNYANAGMSQQIIEQVTHPQKQATKMSGYYDKRGLLNKAIQFYDEVMRNPNVPTLYKF